MTMRYRTLTAAAIVVALGVGTAGCGRYSIGALKGQKAYKDANERYKASDWREAAEKYEYVLQQDPSRTEVYFFLANSYDNAYKPARAGEPENDVLIQKAIENYQKAAQLDTNPQMKTLAMQYLVAAYGPDKLNDPTKAEPIVQQMISLSPNEAGNYFALARIYEDAGRYEEAEQALLKARDTNPNDVAVYVQMSGFYNRQGEFEKTMEALHKAADIKPDDPQGHQLVATYYWEKAQKDHLLTPAKKKEYITNGIEATNRALALNPDYVEALTYKNILLRMQGNLETDMAKRAALYKEAQQLYDRAMELNKRKTAGK
ncbi:MAG TPA: tetratricopeptide repeat protein [Vicinamibacterales bacterium]|nr:tetratricopeptide repeat protein [Vicinamibacterales bacterium]